MASLKSRLAVLACSVSLVAAPALAEGDPDPTPPPVKAEKAAGATLAEAKLASRDIIENLKQIRSNIVLEEETIRYLKVKLERMELESKVAEAEGRPAPTPGAQKKGGAPAPSYSGPSRAAAPAPMEGAELLVKAVTTRPFKEAIVTYKGRVYTVRPGDRLGPYEIKDINDSGVVTSGEGAGRSVLMGR